MTAGAPARALTTRGSASTMAMTDRGVYEDPLCCTQVVFHAVNADPYDRCVPTITTSTLSNGLPLHRIALPGTRATTILVAFDAGARTERPEENGMAHFLEHLVFKGGELYDDYRKVN